MKVLPTARMIEDSISPEGIRLQTMLIRHPRFVHSEFMTHRVLSRNGRSSRAVPVSRLLREPIVEPMFYGSNRPGMSAAEELTGWRYWLARGAWLGLAHTTRLAVRLMHLAGLHKQWANRPLEWFGSIDVLVTSTDWANFYALRDHPAAQPEIQHLAREMLAASQASTPRRLMPGEWHLPWVSQDERDTLPLDQQKTLSVARCARLTFEPFDGSADYEAEQARVRKLIGAQPMHASPAEHQATPDRYVADLPGLRGFWMKPELHGNLRGWAQYRKTLDGECVQDSQVKEAA